MSPFKRDQIGQWTMRLIATLLCTLVVFSFLAAPAMSEETDTSATAAITPDAECDHVVRIAPSGIKFSPASLTVDDGATVCWQWTNESMAHNVVETAEEGGTAAADATTPRSLRSTRSSIACVAFSYNSTTVAGMPRPSRLWKMEMTMLSISGLPVMRDPVSLSSGTCSFT